MIISHKDRTQNTTMVQSISRPFCHSVLTKNNNYYHKKYGEEHPFAQPFVLARARVAKLPTRRAGYS